QIGVCEGRYAEHERELTGRGGSVGRVVAPADAVVLFATGGDARARPFGHVAAHVVNFAASRAFRRAACRPRGAGPALVFDVVAGTRVVGRRVRRIRPHVAARAGPAGELPLLLGTELHAGGFAGGCCLGLVHRGPRDHALFGAGPGSRDATVVHERVR